MIESQQYMLLVQINKLEIQQGTVYKIRIDRINAKMEKEQEFQVQEFDNVKNMEMLILFVMKIEEKIK